MDNLILLVEDSASDEKLALVALKRCGVQNEVVVARDGVQALDLLFGRDGPDGRLAIATPTLILLDLKMPRLSGLEVLQRVRADRRTRLVPVVILTASREDQDVLQSYALGANAYVCKPVDFAEFALAVKTLGLFWLSLNERPPTGNDAP